MSNVPSTPDTATPFNRDHLMARRAYVHALAAAIILDNARDLTMKAIDMLTDARYKSPSAIVVQQLDLVEDAARMADDTVFRTSRMVSNVASEAGDNLIDLMRCSSPDGLVDAAFQFKEDAQRYASDAALNAVCRMLRLNEHGFRAKPSTSTADLLFAAKEAEKEINNTLAATVYCDTQS